jgi:hypothetical protein
MEAHCNFDRLKVKGGDGSKSDPFIIHAFNGFSSASAQKDAISVVYGAGQWTVVGRNYYESSNGKPGNKDLCEWIIEVGGGKVSVWFDLYIVTLYQTDPKWIAERQKIFGPPNPKIMGAIASELAKRVQVVVDRSPSDLEPVQELKCLNDARALDSKPTISSIQQQTSVFKEYGTSFRNPILVNGMIGLAIYLKSLRFKHSTTPTKGILEHSIMHGNYPVDCLRVGDGGHEQHLYFCVYGKRCDTIYPIGFYRQPFEGDFDFELADFIGVASAVQLRGTSEKPVDLGICIFASDPNLAQPSPKFVDGRKRRNLVIYRCLDHTSTSDAAALTGHVSQYGKVFGNGRSGQSARTECSEDSTFDDDAVGKCWFSGQLAIPGCELMIPMYKVISRGGVFTNTVDYERKDVAIPRCSEAKQLHDKNNGKGRLWTMIGVGVGWVICLLTQVKPWIGIVAGGVVGLTYGLASKKRVANGWKQHMDWRVHPDVQALRKQGWSPWKPSA